VATNTKILAEGIPKMKNLVTLIKTTAENITKLLPEILHLVETADDVGKKAKDEGKLTPGDCMAFSTKEKLPKEELDSLRQKKEKAKLNNKDEKQKAKDEK